MRHTLCPACGAEIATGNINVAEGVALCTGCGELSRLAEVVSATRSLADLLSNPPPGCSWSEWGDEMRVNATLRSVGTFFGSLFFALFWNGITSVFVLLAIAGLYANLIGPPPSWFPAPVMNDLPMSLGMSLFLCVFLLPFVTVGLVMAGVVVLAAAGTAEARLGHHDAQVRTGVGPLVWTRRFDPTQVRRVGEGLTSWKTNDESRVAIVIEADRKVKFGSMLSDERREWMRAALHWLLIARREDRRGR